jgi:hypothetical protein
LLQRHHIWQHPDSHAASLLSIYTFPQICMHEQSRIVLSWQRILHSTRHHAYNKLGNNTDNKGSLELQEANFKVGKAGVQMNMSLGPGWEKKEWKKRKGTRESGKPWW